MRSSTVLCVRKCLHKTKKKIVILNPNLFKYPSQEHQCILFKNAYASKSLAKSMRLGKAYSQRK